MLLTIFKNKSRFRKSAFRKLGFLTASFIVTAMILQARCASGGGNIVRVHFIAVGYGDAILVEFPDSSTLLIDAGPRQAGRNY